MLRVSKRAGEFITLRELVDEVGADACRYFFLSRSPATQMEFDLELAKRESTENPVYYVQYAHARIAGILSKARERAIDWSEGDVSLLQDASELALIRKMVYLPELVESMARTLEPHHLPHYSLELATAFHWFYDKLSRPFRRSRRPAHNPGAIEAGRSSPDRAFQDPVPHGHGGARADVESSYGTSTARVTWVCR